VELTEDLIEHIEDLEGFEEEAYYDVNGVLTIGFGHTNATKTFEFDEDTKITREKALAILLADLNVAQKQVEQKLKNRNLTVNDEVKNFMILVEFNRPWALSKTMEDIATMNADIALQSQIDVYKEERDTEPPGWFMDRLNKEFKYLNEFDAKDETGGDNTEEKEWQKYRFVGGMLLGEEATTEIWAEALQRLYGPTDRSGVIEFHPVKPKEEKQSIFGNIKNYVKEQVGNPIDKHMDFMERVYGKRQ